MSMSTVQHHARHAQGGRVLAVQNTNDSSIASKVSMCERGYFSDPFIKFFVSKAVRRAPLINRGYYVRAKALSTVVTSFVQQNNSGCQVVSLGAGFDTTYFRLHTEGQLSSCKYFEVDYPEVIGRKCDILKKIPEYHTLSQRTYSGHEVIQIGTYTAFGCDITEVQKLEQLLCVHGIDQKLQTLIIAECVLSYIDPHRVDHLLCWCAKFFQNAVFCTYEQVNPNDRFGQVMLEHFISRGSPLKGLNKYPNQESQERRYIEAGWEKVLCCKMNDFYVSLSSSEKLRVESLELFDEFEEWHLKCDHYIILCGAVGQCVPFLNWLPFPHSSGPIVSSINKLSLSFTSSIIGRYAHCSVQRADGEVIVYGGYGCSPDRGIKVRNIELCGDEECKPGSLMHHKAVLLPNGDLLMYGGRTSPQEANANFYLCSMCTDKTFVRKLHFSSHIPARWRHTMTLLSKNGAHFVVIIGGCSDTSSALDDCYVLNVEESHLKMVSKLPSGLHSHCAVFHNDGVLVIGGLNSAMIPQSSTWLLKPYFNGKGIEWKLSTVEFTPRLPARYGATGIVKDDIAWMVGGVSMSQGPQVLMLNLITKSWLGYDFLPPLTREHPLLQNCTVHFHNGKKLLVIGGGGNLFSFGTCINCLATVIATNL